MAIISKIILTGKGDYNATTNYELLDYVRYHNCTWVAKGPVVGVAPPTDPTGVSDKWSLLCRDGEYTGQLPTWNDIDEKPFETINSTDFSVDSDGELSVNYPTVEWESVDDKPFNSVSSSFNTTNNVLDVKIDGETLVKGDDGTLSAVATASGFDIHSLQTESELANGDELPFYDVSANATKKTLWSNIIAKFNAISSKVYAEDTTIVSTTTIKDSVDSINNNSSSNQIAGANAVKSIYKNISPFPTNAPSYSTSKKYDVGDVVKYNNSVYYCNTAITTPEAWNQDKWTLWGNNIPIRLGVSADGEYGYYKAGADSVTPFKKGTLKRVTLGTVQGSQTFNVRASYPDIDYSTISAENFVVVQTANNSNSGNGDAKKIKTYTGNADVSMSISGSVNSYPSSITYSNGVLTVVSSYITGNGSASASGAGFGTGKLENSYSIGATYDSCTVYFYYIDN